MGRHTKLKLPEGTPKSEEPSRPMSQALAEAYLAKTYEIEIQLGEQLDRLTTVQSAIEEALASGHATPAMVRESAALSRSLVAISAELRQREAHRSKVGETMSKDEAIALLMEWVVVMPAHHRKKLSARLDELAELDTKKSLLG